MGIGYEIIRLEAAERALARYQASQAVEQAREAREQRKTVEKSRTAAQLAEVDRQIAAVKAQLDLEEDDHPGLWPLRKKLVGLHNKHRELLNQLNGGRHR